MGNVSHDEAVVCQKRPARVCHLGRRPNHQGSAEQRMAVYVLMVSLASRRKHCDLADAFGHCIVPKEHAYPYQGCHICRGGEQGDFGARTLVTNIYRFLAVVFKPQSCDHN